MLLQLLFLSFIPWALTDIPNGYNFWWTALGDSYASGVGSGTYTGGNRCLRYDQAYPALMQGNNDLGPGTTSADKTLFQNCVCSGAEVDDVEKLQLLDSDQWSGFQYGYRQKFGEPSVATLTVGGDDIDFPGILFNCILETHLPFSGPPYRTCDDQRKRTWSLINDPALVTSISGLIGKIVTKARQGQAGNNFKLYVTGYGQFFNNETTACNDVTFARSANPKPDNKPHTMMTTELRTDFNAMSLGLNAAVQKAVAQNTQNGVKYIDIDGPLDGHRFCEDGIQEPDQQNPDLWFWHYPYNQPDSAEVGATGPDYTSVIQAANAKVFGNQSISQLSQQYDSTRAVDDALYNAIDWDQVQQLGGVNATGFWDGLIGYRAKLFHPQVPWHTWIENTIVEQWKQDRDIDSTGATSTQTSNPPASATPPPPPAYATGTCSFHLTETQDCLGDWGSNLHGVVKMYDNNNNVIGQTVTDKAHPNGYPMDANNSYQFNSKLKDPLVITGEHEHDYVQFTIGSLSWQSKTPNGGASCKVGGWDPRDGPSCVWENGGLLEYQNATHNMDCSFPC